MGFLVLVFILFILLYGGLCILLGMVLGHKDMDRYDEKMKGALYMKAINEDLVERLEIKDEIIRGMNLKLGNNQ
jgi:hypothetical protein